MSNQQIESWQELVISDCKTFHSYMGQPAYTKRFLYVMKFHEPGLAPVNSDEGAYHIDIYGNQAYSKRFLATFGFYQNRAAVEDVDGWFHISTDGSQLYFERYAWCGNFQEGFCVVRNKAGFYFHIDLNGHQVYSERYEYAGDFKDGYAVIQKQAYTTHINKNGKFLHNKWFEDLDVFHKGFARAKDKDGWFHINEKGEALYLARYAHVEPFYNGKARVETFLQEILIIDEASRNTHTIAKAAIDPFHVASSYLVNFWQLETIKAACKLNVFDYLPNSIDQIAIGVSLPCSILKRLLNALKEMKLVKEDDTHYWKAIECAEFFKSNHPFSLKQAVNLWTDEHQESWEELTKSLKTGQSVFEKKHQKNWFEYLQENPQKQELYHKVIETYAKRDYQKFSEIIDFTKYVNLLDVGGSTGVLSKQLIQKYPQLNMILLDLPSVVDKIIDLDSKIKKVGCNFFEKWPKIQVDGVIIARILHDWDDEKAKHILMQVHNCLYHNKNSRLFILENILDEKSGSGSLLDLNMLVMTGGKERGFKEFNRLLEATGFTFDHLIPLNKVSSVIVAKLCL